MTDRDPTNRTLEDIVADLDASDAEVEAGLYVPGEAVTAKLRAALARLDAAAWPTTQRRDAHPR